MRELKIGTAWVRGVVGEALTPELVIGFAQAFGAWVEGGPVILGRDTRRSSPMVRSAALSGLLASGCAVEDLGECPTPLLAFAVRERGAAGGLAVTGSHNDAAWNALKFYGPDGTLLNAVRSEEWLDLYHAALFRAAPGGEGRLYAAPEGLVDRYAEHLAALVDAERVRARGFRVAVDFRHGPLADVADRFLRRLGVALVPVRASPAPGPVPGDETAVETAVRTEAADLGAVLTMDGGRLALVTERGDRLSEEDTLPLLAAQRLAARPGPVVTNRSTSIRVDAVARAHGQRVLRTAVGESPIMDRAWAEGAALAGEGSGGAAALPGVTTFDGLHALSLALDLLARDAVPLSERVGALPRTRMRKDQVRCPPARAYRAMAEVRASLSGEWEETGDGVRAAWDDASWVHVRVSNTEPVVRVIAEAFDAERADRLFEECLARVRAAAEGNAE